MRTRRLRPGQCVELHGPITVMCCAGSVWIKPQAVLLTAGERYTFEDHAPALLCGHEGMRDEWLNDTGIIVVRLW
jgi:hypothetical protein